MISFSTQKREAAKTALWEAESQLRQTMELRRTTQHIPPYILRRQYSTRTILIAVARVRALRLLSASMVIA